MIPIFSHLERMLRERRKWFCENALCCWDIGLSECWCWTDDAGTPADRHVRPTWTEAGDLVAGGRAEEDDGIVEGKAFYGPADPDYRAATLKCLLLPDLTKH